MDTFFEQIVRIKKTGKSIAAFVAIWLMALTVCGLAILFSAYLRTIFVFIIAGALYGAYVLSGKLNIEYEYIVTNTTLDVDKIVNKSSRQRMLSVELPTASRLEKFTPALLNNIDNKKLVVASNKDSQNAYFLVCEKEGSGASYLVFEPNEKMQSAIVKSLPKFVANSAFK